MFINNDDDDDDDFGEPGVKLDGSGAFRVPSSFPVSSHYLHSYYLHLHHHCCHHHFRFVIDAMTQEDSGCIPSSEQQKSGQKYNIFNLTYIRFLSTESHLP